MCRPKRLGGRRCPSHSDPTLIAARNAKRRESYHASKVKALHEQSPEEATGVKVSNAARRGVFRKSGEAFLNREFAGKKIADMFKQKDVSKDSQKINIKSSENEGYLVEKNYFSSKEVRGTINYNNLDENSYKEFGFQQIDEDFEKHRSAALSSEEFLELSREEIKVLNNEEKLSLRFFTSGEFQWFNTALYSGKARGSSKLGVSEVFKDAKDDSSAPRVSHGEQNEETINYITEKMDAALAKGPGVQRIVYRGVPQSSPVLGGDTGKWLDENSKLGQEVTFDGYQSTSHAYHVANSYAGNGGLIYEILTPEGVNVSSNSDYEWENEVTLPRQSRYMVVGVHKDVKRKNLNKTMNIVQLVAINDKGEILTGDNETAKTPPFKIKENEENV